MTNSTTFSIIFFKFIGRNKRNTLQMLTVETKNGSITYILQAGQLQRRTTDDTICDNNI